jgi:hypothetical protein
MWNVIGSILVTNFHPPPPPPHVKHIHMGGKEPTNLKNSSLLLEGGGGDIKQRLGHALFHPMFSLPSDEFPVKRGYTLEIVNLI